MKLKPPLRFKRSASKWGSNYAIVVTDNNSNNTECLYLVDEFFKNSLFTYFCFLLDSELLVKINRRKNANN